MKLNNLVLIILIIPFLGFSQRYRYTNTLFPSSTITQNVIYGTAPSVDGLGTVESSTTPQNLVMDVYRPTGDTFTNRPVIIFAHPGGFFSGNKNVDDMMAFCDYFARKGYVTATIDYRLGFNVTSNIVMHSTRAVYRGLQDGRTAIRYFRANAATYGIDPNKVYFVGSSAGAFIALHSIYLDQISEKPAETGVVQYSNITPPFSHTAPDLGGLDIGTNLAFNGKPDAVISLWGAIQNTNLITSNNNTPVFLVHGEADTTVPFNTGSPFGYSALPTADGSNPIKNKLNLLNFTNNETYFVAGVGHEFYGVSNGTWSNGTGGNSYWPIVLDKSTSFLWKQHKSTANYTSTTNGLTVNFTDTSTGATAWFWDFGDGTTSNLQSPTHTFATTGNYTVSLYVENLNKSWDEINRSISLSTMGLADNSNSLFILYPNPSQKNVTISLSNISSEINCQIFDCSGKIVRENLFQNCKEFTIDISDFAIGLYFIKLNYDEKNAIGKLIKN
jgi:acetyl esterase/lipase